jgi:hypothetical protein
MREIKTDKKCLLLCTFPETIPHPYGLEELILLKYLCYPKQPADSMLSL